MPVVPPHEVRRTAVGSTYLENLTVPLRGADVPAGNSDAITLLSVHEDLLQRLDLCIVLRRPAAAKRLPVINAGFPQFFAPTDRRKHGR